MTERAAPGFRCCRTALPRVRHGSGGAQRTSDKRQSDTAGEPNSHVVNGGRDGCQGRRQDDSNAATKQREANDPDRTRRRPPHQVLRDPEPPRSLIVWLIAENVPLIVRINHSRKTATMITIARPSDSTNVVLGDRPWIQPTEEESCLPRSSRWGRSLAWGASRPLVSSFPESLVESSTAAGCQSHHGPSGNSSLIQHYSHPCRRRRLTQIRCPSPHHQVRQRGQQQPDCDPR